MRYVLLTSLVLALGCAHRAQPEATNVPSSQMAPPPSAAPIATACAADAACAGGQLCVREQCLAITANMNECEISKVGFQPNTASLTPQADQKLGRLARCLKASQNTQLFIETSADERASLDANMRLAEARANQIAKELEQRGVPADRLSTLTVASMTMICGPGKNCTVMEGGNVVPQEKRAARPGHPKM